MSTTIFIAQFMGIFMLGAGLSMIFQREMVKGIFDDVFGNRGITYVLGMFEFVGALLLVLSHNVWSGGILPVVVTILSWVLLFEGGFYLSASKETIGKFRLMLKKDSIYTSLSIVYLLISIYFIYSAF